MHNKKPLETTNHLLFFRYSLLGLPIAFAGLPLYINLPKFFLDIYSIDLALIGAVLLSLRILDAFIDPIIGMISDRSTRYLKIIMLLGAIISVFSFNGLFYLPNFLIMMPIVWFTIMTALVYLGYSMLTINFYACGLSLARSYKKRTLLSAYREGFILAGILIASLLPQLLQGYFTQVLSFRIYGIILVIIMIIALVFFPFYSLDYNRRDEFSFSKLKLILKNNSKIKMVFIILFLNTLPVAITSNLFLFFTQDILKSNVPGNFLATYFLAASLSPLIWTPLVNTLGKKNALFIGMLIAILSFVWSFFLTSQTHHYFYIVCIFSGFALGADAIILPAIIADLMHSKEYLSSSIFGLWQAINKWALALAAGLVLPLLSLMGYQPGLPPSDLAITSLSFGYAIIPCIFKIFALILIVRSKIDDKSI